MVTDAHGSLLTERLRDWAAAAVGEGTAIAEVRPLHDDGPPWQLTMEHAGGTTGAVLRAAVGPRFGRWPFFITTGAAALKIAEQYSVPAPRLIAADMDGATAGAVATLESLVSGSTEWPSPWSAERLRAAGAALARVQTIALAPSEHLPLRPRPVAVDDFADARRKGWLPTTPLLRSADELITAHGAPGGETVFVHGDVWAGNVVWAEDDEAVLIDWKTAGVGAPGVDLCCLRSYLAIMFGREAPDLVLDGWERAAGTKASDVAYWDAVAALNTRTELDDEYMMEGATDRRDAFLQAALANLGA